MGSLDSSIPTAPFSALDPKEFRTQAHRMVDFIADYYENIEAYPVLSKVPSGHLRAKLPQMPPHFPEGLDTILGDVTRHIVPSLTHWMSPNFFAFFPASASVAGILGEMLCTGFNIVGFNWQASPAATELEMVVIDWLANLLNLPPSFMFSGSGGGVLQRNTAESILVTLVAAKKRVLESRSWSENFSDKLVVYASDQTHTALIKASKLAGIPSSNIRVIPTDIKTEFSMSPMRLSETIAVDLSVGLIPLYLCLTVGTTSTTAVDPLLPLAKIANKYGIWVHVDAAYAGSSCICPEFRRYLDGVELVDSISMSPHKWLLSCGECSCLWLKEPSQVTKAIGTSPEYLKNKATEQGSVVDFKDWQLVTSRKFKSLRLWFVMRCYGVGNLQRHIRSDVNMAKMFEEQVKADPRFEIVVPRRFALVCFRLKPCPSGDVDNLNQQLLEWVNETGQVYLSHSMVGGMYFLRLAVGATLTKEHHVSSAWLLIKRGADTLVGSAKRLIA